MVHFENSSTQVPKPMENPRKKKAQMKTIVRVGSPEENRIRLNKREKSRRKKEKISKLKNGEADQRGKLPRPFYTPEIRMSPVTPMPEVRKAKFLVVFFAFECVRTDFSSLTGKR